MYNNRGFTLIEFLVSLVLIGFIVTLLINFFSNPLKEASVDAKVRQVIETHRMVANAFNAAYMRDMEAVSSDPWGTLFALSTNGFLSNEPIYPDEIGDTSGNYTRTSRGLTRRPIDTTGINRSLFLTLDYVSDEFCKSYNKEQGLGEVIIPNCSSAPDATCTTRGDSNNQNFGAVAAGTFCYFRADHNCVLYDIGIIP